MKGKQIAALLLALTLLAGCGTSRLSSVEESIPQEGSWQDLTLPGLSPSPKPSASTVMPKLELDTDEGTGTDVTKDYKDAFIGTWDGEPSGLTYEFRGNENLLISSGGSEKTYTYWFLDTGNQVRLCIYENGADAEVRYSFTKKGDNITLYDVSTGDEVELLVRRPSPTPTPSKAPAVITSAAPASPAPVTTAPSPSPSPSAEPSPSPSAVPSPSPSTEPSPSPSVAPSPSPSPEIQVPAAVQAALPKVECVLDVVVVGGSFGTSDTDSFWSIMARYASQGSYPREEGYAVLTPEEMLSCAGQVYAGLTSLPECPEGSKVVIHQAADEAAGTPERYKLQLGNLAGLDMKVISCDGDSTFQVEIRYDNNAFRYEVALSGGAIASITEK